MYIISLFELQLLPLVRLCIIFCRVVRWGKVCRCGSATRSSHPHACRRSLPTERA